MTPDRESMQAMNVASGYPIRYQFERKDDPMVVLQSAGEQEFELSDMQLRMLSSDALNGVIRAVPVQFNDRLFLHYSLRGKRLLGAELRRQSVSSDQAARLVSRLVEIVSEASGHFLSPDRFVLAPELIFAGERLEDVHLLYVPVRGSLGTDCRQGLRNVLLDLLGHLDRWDGELWPSLLRMLNDEQCGLQQLKSAIAGRKAPAAAGPEESAMMLGGRREVPSGSIANSRQAEQPTRTQQSEDRPAAFEAAPLTQSGDALGWWTDDTGTLASEREDGERRVWRFPTLWMTALIAAAANAAGWLAFRHYPSEGLLYVNIGLGLLGLDACYVVYHLREPSSMPLKFRLAAAGDHAEWPDAPSGEAVISEMLPYPSAGTTVLTQSPATVHLGSLEETAMEAQDRSLALVKIRNGERIVHRLAADVTVIGRDASSTIVDASKGVSRAHLEIRRSTPPETLTSSGGKELVGFETRDLGSVNGTLLNGESMVPYRWYPLQPGDQLELAKQIYDVEEAGSPVRR